jgi:hypothetical protein
VLPGGEPLPPGTVMVGRGPDLHLIGGGHWYGYSVRLGR